MPLAAHRALYAPRSHDPEETFRTEGVAAPKTSWVVIKDLTVLLNTDAALQSEALLTLK